jgi:DNA-directed RNA polymerase specialized sigma24 family protein
MTTDDDDQLMRAWVQGDARAFDRLYERHHAALYRFVRRVLGSALAQQVDEVFQDTWSRVIQARERWSPQGAAFRTWLFTLAHHRAVDCLRKSGREVSVDDGRPAATRARPATPGPTGRRPTHATQPTRPSGVPRVNACCCAWTRCRPRSARSSCCTTRTG